MGRCGRASLSTGSLLLGALWVAGCGEQPEPATETQLERRAEHVASPAPSLLPPIASPDHPFIVLAWEQRTAAAGLQWVSVAGPLAVAGAVERHVRWTPRYGDLVVDMTATSDAAVVAARAREAGAAYVFTGWYHRPAWEFEAGVVLWRVDAIAALPIAQATARGPLADAHLIISRVLTSVLRNANVAMPRPLEEKLLQPLTRDNYSTMLTGRGLLAMLTGLTPQGKAAAQADLVKASRIDPGNPVIARLLGEYWLRDEADPTAAAQAARSMALAADLDPTYAPALLGVAAAAASRGDWDDAGKRYAQAVALRPWDLTARLGWAKSALQTERYQEALTVLLEMKAVRGDLLEVRRLLAVAYDATGELERLVDELLAVAVLAPTDMSAQLDLASAYVALAQLGRAVDVLSPLAKVSQAPIDKVWMGDILRHAARFDEALAWYEQALVPDPAAATLPPWRVQPPVLHPRAVYERAMLRARVAQTPDATLAEAMAAVEGVPELAPQLPWIAAEAAFARGNFAAAAMAYRDAVHADPDDVDTRYNLVWSLLKAGEAGAAQAQAEAEAAIARMPGYADLHYVLAASLYVDGQTSRARQVLAEVLVLAPEDAVARRAVTAIDNGAPMLPQGALRPHDAFLDVVVAKRQIERILALRRERDGLRTQWFAASRDILTALGRLPLSEARRVRRCPATNVAQLQAQQRQLELAYLQRGVEQGRLEVQVQNAVTFGDIQFLSRFARLRAADVMTGLSQGELDLREMWFTRDSLLAGELAAAGCTPALLAAAYDPTRRQALPLPVAEVPPRGTMTATTITFFIDNRGCPDPVDVTIDGVPLGRVEAQRVRGISSHAGTRIVCLTEPGTPCGVQGSVRELYLNDGLTVNMRCPDAGSPDR